ncbi:MAG: OPT/YSL family transporter [Candidatus Thorarchaeota archaeon]
MIKKPEPTRALLVGLFGAGLFYALVVVLEIGWTYATLTAVLIEAALLIGSLVSRPLDKKGLGLFCLTALIYFLTVLALNQFHEVVVMAIGGIAIFSALTSEPKFPLTKRAIGTGIGVGIVMTFLGIYLALKLGVVYFVGAEMLGALILSANGKYTKEENTVVVAIANGSSMIAIGVLITFPAIAIFRPDVAITLISYPFIVVVTSISAIFGMLLLAPFRDRFEDMPWPQVKPQAETIISLGADTQAKRTVIAGLLGAGAYVGVTKVAESFLKLANENYSLASVPKALEVVVPAAGTFPDWIGLSNSPLIAAIGFFVGWKRTLVVALGSLISLMIWIFIEGMVPIEFGEHLTRPEILYLALGVFATVIMGDVLSSKKDNNKDSETIEPKQDEIENPEEEQALAETITIPSQKLRLQRVREEILSMETLREEIRQVIENPREFLRSKRGQVPPWVAFVSMTLFIISGIIIFSIIRPFVGIDIHWALFVFGAPIALLSAYFTARAISETGMLAGYISDIIAIPAIILFQVTFQAITTFMSMLGALQDSAIALLVHLKLGRLTGVKGRDIAKAVFVGALIGIFIGSAITYVIYVTYGFGGSDFPAPAAQLFGFLVESLTGLGNFQLPGLGDFEGVHPALAFLYLVSFGVAGYLLGREIIKRDLSPMSLVVGILIPPATSVAMLIGGYIDYRKKKKRSAEDQLPDEDYKKTSRILSGVVAGEAVVTVVWVLWSALMFIF